MSSTTHALKEWAVAVNALEAGKTILLLRKGGIREENNRFEVTYRNVLLYPTYEHQKPYLLKPEYASQVTPVQSGWHPETVRIGSWAKITNIFEIRQPETVNALIPYAIWNEEFAIARFNWKPRQPLYVLLLRTYRLSTPFNIPYRNEYGGCKSWIKLGESISLNNLIPVLNEQNYQKKVAEIKEICSSEHLKT
ncbi:MAG: DUF1802 family protein [Chroococcales cyanobacterium]